MAEKSIVRKAYENVMGTPEQNAEAEKRMAEQDKKNPDTAQAKLNKVVKKVSDAGVGARNAGRLYGKSIGMDVGPYEKERGMKKGGMTASKRADGCAQRGKTKGRIV